MSRRFELLSPLLLALGAASCGHSGGAASSAATAAEENAIVQLKERGPVSVELRVEPKSISFAERLRFTITAWAEKGVEVEMPSPGESLGEFLIRDYAAQPAKEGANGRGESRQSYVLEVLTSGKYTIPELRIGFVDRRPKAEGEGPHSPQSPVTAPAPGSEPPAPVGDEAPPAPEASGGESFKILTDPIQVEVRSLEDVTALESLRPIAPVAEPPPLPLSLRGPLIAGAVVVGVAALVALFVLLRRRRKLRPPPPPPPPEVVAYRELEWLIGQDFPGRGELKEFFFHLSRIVREYIERRFGLRAPESTTEEFLADLARSEVLGAEHKLLLRRFLERADLVKFARHEPSAAEIEQSFEAAKGFIAQTWPQPATAEEAQGALG